VRLMYEQKTNQSNLLTVRLILGCALWSVKYGKLSFRLCPCATCKAVHNMTPVLVYKTKYLLK